MTIGTIITSLGNAIATIILCLVGAIVILDVGVDDIKEYLVEREKQKTIREYLNIQRDREALGVAEEEHLLAGVDASIEDLIHGDESIEEDELDKVEPDRDGEIEARNPTQPSRELQWVKVKIECIFESRLKWKI